MDCRYKNGDLRPHRPWRRWSKDGIWCAACGRTAYEVEVIVARQYPPTERDIDAIRCERVERERREVERRAVRERSYRKDSLPFVLLLSALEIPNHTDPQEDAPGWAWVHEPSDLWFPSSI